MKNNNIEIYEAKNAFNWTVATLKVWRKKVMFESSGKKEVVRQIVSVTGEADLGDAKLWTRGAAIKEWHRHMGLPQGLKWERA
jgi:hypothetical protein